MVRLAERVGGDVMSYRDLSFPHDAVCALSILFVLLGFVVTLLVAEQPQGLRALQLNLKFLRRRRRKKQKNKNKKVNFAKTFCNK